MPGNAPQPASAPKLDAPKPASAPKPSVAPEPPQSSAMPVDERTKDRMGNPIPLRNVAGQQGMVSPDPVEPAPATVAAPALTPAMPAAPSFNNAMTSPQLPPMGLPALPQMSAIPLPEPVPVSLPEISVERAPPPKIKTWLTKLEPSIIPPTTSFNYKRNLLPGSIYRSEYDKLNQHLPARITRQDYDSMLLGSVSRNDVDGVRALLNAGANPNAVTADGETTLALAQRVGAAQVAQLLEIRGAK